MRPLAMMFRPSLGGAFRRFPWLMAAAVLATLAALLALHAGCGRDFALQCARVAAVMVSGFPLLVAVSYAGEINRRARVPSLVAAFAIMLGFWFLLPGGDDPFAFWYRYGVILLFAVALSSAVPAFAGDSSWWRANVGLLQALLLAFILSVVVEAGLQIASASVGALFGWWSARLSFDILFVVALFVAPLAVVSLLPARDGVAGGAPVFADYWRRLCQWVLVPLGFLYIAILVVYALLIVIRHQLPDGMVALPVLVLGAYGTASMLLLQPWRAEHAWAHRFFRIYPVAFVFCSVLPFFALAERIGMYGMTFDRYSALAVGIWFVVAAVVFLFRSRVASLLVMLALALICAAAAIGPASAGAWSLRSQTVRISRLLREPVRDDAQIFSGLRFLAESFGRSAVEKFSGPLGEVDAGSSWVIARAAAKQLGISTGPAGKAAAREEFAYRWSGKAFPLEGFSGMFSGDKPDLGKTKAGETIEVRLSNGRISMFADGTELRQLLPDGSGALPDKDKPFTVSFSIDGRDFLLFVQRAGGLQHDGKMTRIWFAEYLILEK